MAAYPHGSPDIESSTSRIPGYTEEIQTMDVEIVDSIAALYARGDRSAATALEVALGGLGVEVEALDAAETVTRLLEVDEADLRAVAREALRRRERS